jgi:hypothetical protein
LVLFFRDHVSIGHKVFTCNLSVVLGLELVEEINSLLDVHKLFELETNQASDFTTSKLNSVTYRGLLLLVLCLLIRLTLITIHTILTLLNLLTLLSLLALLALRGLWLLRLRLLDFRLLNLGLLELRLFVANRKHLGFLFSRCHGCGDGQCVAGVLSRARSLKVLWGGAEA